MLALHHESGFRVGAMVKLQDETASKCSRHEQLRGGLYMAIIVPGGSALQCSGRNDDSSVWCTSFADLVSGRAG